MPTETVPAFGAMDVLVFLTGGMLDVSLLSQPMLRFRSPKVSAANRVVAVIPCNDLQASEAFYQLLGFGREPGAADWGEYVILKEPGGAEVHLTKAPEGWLIPGKSPFGIYFYADNVDKLASRLKGKLLHPPRKQPWGMYEFAVSDPDENLVRVGGPMPGEPAD